MFREYEKELICPGLLLGTQEVRSISRVIRELGARAKGTTALAVREWAAQLRQQIEMWDDSGARCQEPFGNETQSSSSEPIRNFGTDVQKLFHALIA
jgi:hypothetical protein